MKQNIFAGKLVRLDVPNIEDDSNMLAQWSHNSDYMRLLNGCPVMPFTGKQQQDSMDRWLSKSYLFMIHAIEPDRRVGFVDLSDIDWGAGDCWVGIGLGERCDWGKGYGTEAMQLLVRFAFQQLNLKRVSLDVFEYNGRAVRSYEKVGFQVEGVARQAIARGGCYWDMIFMGLLREEWDASQTA